VPNLALLNTLGCNALQMSNENHQLHMSHDQSQINTSSVYNSGSIMLQKPPRSSWVRTHDEYHLTPVSRSNPGYFFLPSGAKTTQVQQQQCHIIDCDEGRRNFPSSETEAEVHETTNHPRANYRACHRICPEVSQMTISTTATWDLHRLMWAWGGFLIGVQISGKELTPT
jgi:hypothetical protein